MSAVTSRPRVKSVSTTSIEMAATGCVMLAGLVAAAIRASREERTRLRESKPLSSSAATAIPSPSIVTKALQAAHSSVATARELTGLDTARSELFKSLSMPGIVCREASVRPALEQAERATSVSQLQTASRELMSAVSLAHRELFTESLVAACRNASIEAGFTTVKTLTPSEDMSRVVALDAAGRALVTEIRFGPNADPMIETEVVGVTDGSCQGILDRFDAALVRNGVTADSPKRRGTGGICQLALSKTLKAQQQPPQAVTQNVLRSQKVQERGHSAPRRRTPVR